MLLQVYLHAAIAGRGGEYDVEDVLRAREKMLRRNPHVFGPASRRTTGAGSTSAGRRRRRGEGARGPSRGHPGSHSRRESRRKVLERLQRAGQPVRLDPGTTDLGERLLLLVEEARAGGIDPEQALREAVRRAAG